MSQTLVVSFRLRPGVSPEEFSRFVVDVDHAHNRKRPQCLRFDTFVRPGDGAVEVIEVIEATSKQDWDDAMAGDDQKPIGEQWSRFVDPDSISEQWLDDVHAVARRSTPAP